MRVSKYAHFQQKMSATQGVEQRSGGLDQRPRLGIEDLDLIAQHVAVRELGIQPALGCVESGEELASDSLAKLIENLNVHDQPLSLGCLQAYYST